MRRRSRASTVRVQSLEAPRAPTAEIRGGAGRPCGTGRHGTRREPRPPCRLRGLSGCATPPDDRRGATAQRRRRSASCRGPRRCAQGAERPRLRRWEGSSPSRRDRLRGAPRTTGRSSRARRRSRRPRIGDCPGINAHLLPAQQVTLGFGRAPAGDDEPRGRIDPFARSPTLRSLKRRTVGPGASRGDSPTRRRRTLSANNLHDLLLCGASHSCFLCFTGAGGTEPKVPDLPG